MEVQADKFASIVQRLAPQNPVQVVENVPAEAGVLVAVRALSENLFYPDLELADGTYSRVRPGDIIVGALGSRQALKGFVGYAPYRAAVGETLHLLNMGGVIGRCVDAHPDLGNPVRVELLGAVARDGKVLSLQEGALPPPEPEHPLKPVVLCLGSCMHVGKTVAAVEMIKQLTAAGMRVAGAKISGVGCLRDTRKMESAGAVRTASFLDCGLPSTVDAADLGLTARTLAAHLGADADVIVMELGDGLLGHYHVDTVLGDARFMGAVAAVLYSASDLVSAWGGLELLSRRGIAVTALTGPVTETQAGTEYAETNLKIPAANALLHGGRLRDLVLEKLTVKP